MEHADVDRTPANAAEEVADLDLACTKTMEKLKRIQRGERTLEAMDPEVYIWGEWVGDIDFLDKTNLQDDVLDACTLLHRCFGAGRYDLVLTLGQKLLDLKVHTDDHSGAFDALDLTDLGYLADVPVTTVLLDMMQAEYRTGEHPQKAILKLMDYPRNQKMRLQDMLTAMGGVPEDFTQFLQGWLEMVSQKTDPYSVILTEEAIQLLPDLQGKLDCCRTCVEKSPQFYLNMVRDQAFSEEQRYQVAMDGVQHIPDAFQIRGTVALEAAALAKAMNMPRQDIEALWRDAFYSDTKPMNYLRLLLNAEDPAAARAWLDTVLKRPLPDRTSTRWGEPERNYMSSHRVFQFRILQGDFQGALQPDLWSGSARYQVPLLFTILFPGAPASLLMKRVEIEAMSDLSFSPKEYWMGMPKERRVGINKEQVFRYTLRQWKNTIAFPSPEEGLHLLDQIDGYIAEDVASSLRPSRRKEYRHKAELVAKYGEMRELLGEPNGKQETMHRYAALWYSRMAFVGDLESYGMRY